MEKIRFGKTGLMVSKIAFGGIPIQRLSTEDAVDVVKGCIGLGVNFLDTANGYSDSEEKIGIAIKNMPRDGLVIASKSGAKDKKGLLEHLELSLKRMGTNYVDIYQLHGVSSKEAMDMVFAPGGAYEGLEDAIKAGKVRFPAFSSHSVPIAIDLMKTEKFACTQLPFNFVDNEVLDEAVPLAKKLDIGFIAMKPFGGGLIEDANLAIKYLAQFEGVVPDPGIEKLSEMEEIVAIVNANKPLTAEDELAIEKLKEELGSSWCHRCEYCRPCPQNIAISMALNTKSITKRMPPQRVKAMMSAIMGKAAECTECRACVSRCPYNLDIPLLLKENLEFFERYSSEN